MRFTAILAVGLFALVSCSDGTSAISGKLEGGLRILPVDEKTDKLEYTIYRGDYIVFDFAAPGSYDFQVPGLDISTVMPVTDGNKPYVKMKNSGDYDFSLGNRQGIFHVLELEDASYHEVTAAEAKELIGNVKPVIVDVRTQGEYDSGHIRGAELIPVQVFADNLDSLEAYKNDDVLVYCASGNRSTVAARLLIDAGFTKVYNLRHGIGDWIRSGLPVE